MGAGLLVFTLTAAYMRHAALPDVSFFEITGGAWPAPGEPLLLRVSSRLDDARRALPVQVAAVTHNGHPLPFRVDGESPVLLATTAPDGALSLSVTAPVPSEIDVSPLSDERRLEPTTPAPPTRLGERHLDLIPASGELVAGLPNRVFVRLLDAAQRPIADAPIRVLHSRLPGGRLELRTDPDGLAELWLKADRPNHELEVELSAPTTRHSVTLIPVGRELTLEVSPRARPGQRLSARATSLRPRGTLSCELLRDSPRGPVWVSALDLPITSARLDFDLPLPELPIGTRLDLQCALTPGTGRAWASAPITLSQAPPSLGDSLAQTLSARPWRPPLTLASTRERDRAARDALLSSRRTLLLIALMSVLAALLLLGVSVLVVHTRRTRRELTRALGDDDTLSATTRHDIVRTRGLLHLAVGLALAIGWITAVGALLSRSP